MSPENHPDSLETRPIPELIRDPLLTDHEWSRAEIDRLIGLSSAVEARFPGNEQAPAGLTEHLRTMRAALSNHIDREEQVIFPAVVAGTANEIRGAIRDLELDHESIKGAFRRVRELTGDLTAPDGADAEWSDLYHSLDGFEARIERHNQIEDQILFPRVFFEQPDSPAPGEGSA